MDSRVDSRDGQHLIFRRPTLQGSRRVVELSHLSETFDRHQSRAEQSRAEQLISQINVNITSPVSRITNIGSCSIDGHLTDWLEIPSSYTRAIIILNTEQGRNGDHLRNITSPVPRSPISPFPLSSWMDGGRWTVEDT